MNLPTDTPIGIKLSEAMGGADTVFDIEVTPNRPDWLSVIGIAREVSALTGNPLKLPGTSITEGAERTEKLTSIKVEAPSRLKRHAVERRRPA